MFLSMLFENENTNEGMQSVLNEIHSYVPHAEVEKHIKLMLINKV